MNDNNESNDSGTPESPENELPKIVVLDGYALNPGDLSWEGLRRLGRLEVFDRSTPDETVERARDAEIILTNKVVLSRELMGRLPNLKFIGVMATGYNIIDVAAAAERNVVVTNVPVYSTVSVAQAVFAHVLNLTQRVGDHSAAVREGRWAAAVDWCFWDFPLVELEGATMGIVGLGRIGQATARLANAFGMNVIAHTRTRRDVSDTVGSYEAVELETVFRESDVLSLHCPLTDQTQGLVNAERLALMKSSAFLVNTSRGGLVDEVALADALNNERLAGVGLDVLCDEPPGKDNPLCSAKNCYVTPHLAWATLAARKRLMETVEENVAAFLKGVPQNVVSWKRVASSE